MASYEWIGVGGPDGYLALAHRLDEVFEPKEIAQRLDAEVTDAVQGVLIEHGYVDKDYRSTLYGFYAKKGRAYRRDCVRLHFFDGTVSYDKDRTDVTCKDGSLGHHYFGYIVLRPTMAATLGRSVLSPGIFSGARGRVIQSENQVNVLGHRLPVWGFPSMAQPSDIAVCAHVSCWAILRYYSERFSQYREYLIGDMARLASGFDPGGLVPSLGLTALEAERVFQSAGCFPLVVWKKEGVVADEGFYAQLLAYLESGFPLFVAIGGEHAAVAVGYSWRERSKQPEGRFAHVWEQVDGLLMVDDNTLPYLGVPLVPRAASEVAARYSGAHFDTFIVALPEKIHFPADAVDELSPHLAATLKEGFQVADDGLQLRRYFMTTISELRRHGREHESQMGDVLVRRLMELESAQYVWVVEFCSLAQWDRGHVTGRAIIDATASRRDPVATLLLHDERLAIVFDRKAGRTEHRPELLGRDRGVPLPRMELNLGQVVRA